MGAGPYIVGGVVAAIGIGVIVAVSSSAKADAKKATLPQAPTKLIPGHRYEFVALNPARSSASVLMSGLESLAWKSVVIWLYGDPYTPREVVWPPIVDKSIAYAAHGVWNGSQIDVPPGIMGLRDLGVA